MFPLERPAPDFESFEEILKGERKPDRVHFVELGIDFEVMEYISERLLNQKIPSIYPVIEEKEKRFNTGEGVTPLSDETEKVYLKRTVNFYYRMGYGYVPFPPNISWMVFNVRHYKIFACSSAFRTLGSHSSLLCFSQLTQ